MSKSFSSILSAEIDTENESLQNEMFGVHVTRGQGQHTNGHHHTSIEFIATNLWGSTLFKGHSGGNSKPCQARNWIRWKSGQWNHISKFTLCCYFRYSWFHHLSWWGNGGHYDVGVGYVSMGIVCVLYVVILVCRVCMVCVIHQNVLLMMIVLVFFRVFFSLVR